MARGGKREGAGRPALPVKRTRRWMFLTDDELAKVRTLLRLLRGKG